MALNSLKPETVDICLITPPNRGSSATLPAALLYLHAWLVKNKISTKIIDIKIGRPGVVLTKNQLRQVRSDILEKVKKLRPRYIGIPCYTSEFWDVIDLCKLIKRNYECTIIVGGLHVGIKADDFFFEGTPIDIAVVGDGQYPLVEIIRRIDSGKDMDGVEGVILRAKNGKLRIQGSSSFADWEILPNPDYSQLNMNYYSKPHTGIIRNLIVSGVHIFTTLGCPFSCTFCANGSRKVNYRPIGKVLEEIEGLKDDYKIDSFYILDDTFLLKKSRVIEFVEGLREKRINLIWGMETRVNLIDEEIARLVKESGCIQIDFGVESGSWEALLRMKKGVTTEQIINAFGICRKYNLRSLANFMFNTPGETADDLDKTLRMMEKIKPTRLSICLTVPFPGTSIYNEYVKPPLAKEEYEIYNTPYLYFKVADRRFYMARHQVDMTNLRIRATAKANKFRSIMDYTSNLAYWKTVLKSRKKMLYLKVLLSDFLALLISRGKKVLKIYRFSKTRQRAPAGEANSILILDMSYTLKMFKERKMEQALESRKLGGYFSKVISVHPLAGLFESGNGRFGDPLITHLDNSHVFVEGKIGISRVSCFIPVLNILLAQIRFVRLLLRMAREARVNLIRIGDPHYLGLMGLFLAKSLKVPLAIRVPIRYDEVFQVTGKPAMPQVFRFRWVEKNIERFVFSRCDLIAGANEDNMRYALENGGRPEVATVFRYGNLIHASHWQDPNMRENAEAKLEELGLTDTRFIVTVARLEPMKCVEDVISAVARINKRGYRIKGLIVGDGSMRRKLESLSEALGVGNKMIFTGNRTQEWIASVLPKATVIISPHMGRALAEAALAAVPIVAYDYDWQREVVVDGETGYLVSNKDWKSLSDKVENILNDPVGGKRMGKSAREKILKMMNPEKLELHEKNEYTKMLNNFLEKY
jgi:radical SAM superfamily enzyme YgiQ (UPF0313 family)